jgi:hypothetical protein
MIGVKRDWSGVEKAQGKGKEARPGAKSPTAGAKPAFEPEPAADILHSIEESGEDERDVQSIGFSASIPLGAPDKTAGPIPVSAPRKPPQNRSKRGKQRAGGGGRSKRRG